MKNVSLRSPDSLGSSELNNLGEKFPVNNHNIWQQLVSTLLSLHPVTLEHVSLGFCQVRYLLWRGQGPSQVCQVLTDPPLSHCVRGSALENGVIKIRLLRPLPSRHLEVARKKKEFVNSIFGIIGGLTNVVEMSALILTVANHSNLVKLGFKYEKLDLLLFRNECHMSNNNMISDHKS